MRFSIVTPVYNGEKYLQQMLDSIRSQSLYDWELIIVDDGSTDNTRDIINRAAIDEPRIRLLTLDENSGSCFYPRRVAIEYSNGDYVVNIDADDTVEKDYLYNLESKIIETGADLVYADMYLTEEYKTPEKYIPKDTSVYSKSFIGKELFIQTLDKWEVSGVAATSRNLALASLNLYDQLFTLDRYWGFYHDENLTRIDLYLAEKVAFAHASYFYRQHHDSMSHTLSLKKFDLLEADVNLCNFVSEIYGKDSAEYLQAHRQLFHHVIEHIRLLNDYPNFEDRNQAVKITKTAIKSIDLKAIRNIVSSKYLNLLHLGYYPAKAVLKAYDGKK